MESTLHKILDALKLSSSKDRSVDENHLSNICGFFGKDTKCESEHLVGIYQSVEQENIGTTDVKGFRKKKLKAHQTIYMEGKDYDEKQRHEVKEKVNMMNRGVDSGTSRTRKYGVFGKFYPRSFSLDARFLEQNGTKKSETCKRASSVSERWGTRRSSSLDSDIGSFRSKFGCETQPASFSTESIGHIDNFDGAHCELENTHLNRERQTQNSFDDEEDDFNYDYDDFNPEDSNSADYDYHNGNIIDENSEDKAKTWNIDENYSTHGQQQIFQNTDYKSLDTAIGRLNSSECDIFNKRGSKQSLHKTEVLQTCDYGGSAAIQQQRRSRDVSGHLSATIMAETARQNTDARTDRKKIVAITTNCNEITESHNADLKQSTVDITGYEQWIDASIQCANDVSLKFDTKKLNQKPLQQNYDSEKTDDEESNEICISGQQKPLTSYYNIEPEAPTISAGHKQSIHNHSTDETHISNIHVNKQNMESNHELKRYHIFRQTGSNVDFYGAGTGSDSIYNADSPVDTAVHKTSLPSQIQMHAPKIKISSGYHGPPYNRRFSGLQRGYSENDYQDADTGTENHPFVDSQFCSSSYPIGRDFHFMQENSSRRPMKLRRDSPFAFPLIEEFARNIKSPPTYSSNKNHHLHTGRLNARGEILTEKKTLRGMISRGRAMKVNREERY